MWIWIKCGSYNQIGFIQNLFFRKEIWIYCLYHIWNHCKNNIIFINVKFPRKKNNYVLELFLNLYFTQRPKGFIFRNSNTNSNVTKRLMQLNHNKTKHINTRLCTGLNEDCSLMADSCTITSFHAELNLLLNSFGHRWFNTTIKFPWRNKHWKWNHTGWT